jgi:hypothetical protein
MHGHRYDRWSGYPIPGAQGDRAANQGTGRPGPHYIKIRLGSGQTKHLGIGPGSDQVGIVGSDPAQTRLGTLALNTRRRAVAAAW